MGNEGKNLAEEKQHLVAAIDRLQAAMDGYVAKVREQSAAKVDAAKVDAEQTELQTTEIEGLQKQLQHLEADFRDKTQEITEISAELVQVKAENKALKEKMAKLSRLLEGSISEVEKMVA